MTVEDGASSGAGKLFISKALAAVSNYVAYAILAIALSTADYGLLGTVISSALFVQLLTIGGASWAVMNFYATEKEHRGQSLSVFASIILVTLPVLGSIVFFLPAELNSLLPQGALIFQWLLFVFPIMAFRTLGTFVLQGTKQFRTEALSRTVSAIVLLSGIALVVYYGIVDTFSAILIYAGAELLGFIIVLPKIRQVAQIELVTVDGAKSTLSFSLTAQLAVLFVTVGREGFFLFLAGSQGLVVAGNYNLGASLSIPISLLGEAIAYASFAYVADEREEGGLTFAAMKHMLYLTAFSSLVIWMLSGPILATFFPAYIGAHEILNVLWLAYGLWGVTQMIRSHSYAKNLRMLDAQGAAISTIICTILLTVLIPSLGALGLAILMLLRAVLHGSYLGIRLFAQNLKERGVTVTQGAIVLTTPLIVSWILAQWTSSIIAAAVGLVFLLVLSAMRGDLREEIRFWLRFIRLSFSGGEA